MEGLDRILNQHVPIVHLMQQDSAEWHLARAGKLTASNAKKIATAGKGLETYIFEMLEKSIFSSTENEFTGNSNTDQGNEREPTARFIYEIENSLKIEQVGFIQIGQFLGYSPDGLVGKDGGLEIKCRQRKGHLRTILTQELLDSEMYQIQMSLLLSGRQWWDYVAYNPDFKQSFWRKRILPDAGIQHKIAKGLTKGIAMLEKITSTDAYQIEINKKIGQ